MNSKSNATGPYKKYMKLENKINGGDRANYLKCYSKLSLVNLLNTGSCEYSAINEVQIFIILGCLITVC